MKKKEMLPFRLRELPRFDLKAMASDTEASDLSTVVSIALNFADPARPNQELLRQFDLSFC